MADIKNLGDQLVGLTVKEVNELAQYLKDEYKIEPAAAAVAMAAPVAGGGADAAEAQTSFDVILKSGGQSKLAVMASFNSGLGMAFNASLITRNPGNAAMTAPKPYSDAVFIAASSAPEMAVLVPSANCRLTDVHANNSTVRMPSSRAPSTAQIAVIDATSAVIGFPPGVSTTSDLAP